MIFVLILYVASVFGAKLPPGVQLCHASDPKFDQCIAKNLAGSLKLFATENKELGLPGLEPLFVKEMIINGQSSKSSTSMQQIYKNVYVHGLTDTTIPMIHMELDENCGWTGYFDTPEVRLEADYELSGQLLIFQLNSKGKCNVTQYNLHTRHTMKCEKYKKKGETYVRVTNYTMDMALENVVYHFSNILAGNEQISREISKTINENAMSIFREFKSGFEQIFSMLYLQNANRVFSKIPLNQIILE